MQIPEHLKFYQYSYTLGGGPHIFLQNTHNLTYIGLFSLDCCESLIVFSRTGKTKNVWIIFYHLTFFKGWQVVWNFLEVPHSAILLFCFLFPSFFPIILDLSVKVLLRINSLESFFYLRTLKIQDFLSYKPFRKLLILPGCLFSI